jgi:hypothetical protein
MAITGRKAVDQNQILNSWRKSEHWTPLSFKGIEIPGAFDIEIRDHGGIFSLCALLEKSGSTVDIVFEDRGDVICYSATTLSRNNYIDYDKKINTFIFSVKNDNFSILKFFNFENLEIKINHIVVLSTDITMDIFFIEPPKFYFDGNLVEVDHKYK